MMMQGICQSTTTGWINWAFQSNPSSSEINPINHDIISKANQAVKLLIGDITFKSHNQVCPVILNI